MSFINDVFSGIEKALLGKAEDLLDDILGKGPNKDIMPGDIEISKIMLMSQDRQRKYNLLSQCTGIDIYESMMSPVMFAELVISDSMGLLQSFPIIGEEYVLIEFRTPKTKGMPAQYLFRVNKIMNKKVGEANKNITYTLQLVSAELIKNSSRFVNQKFDNAISETIKDIMFYYIRSEKPVLIDDTIGVEKSTITRMQPFKAIDFLRSRAVASKYLSSSFVFFENRTGFHFTTVERMLDEGGKITGIGSDKEFFFDTSRKESVKDVTLRNIIAYNQVTFTDTISKIQSGGLTSVQQSYDFVAGGIQRVTYTDNVGADKFKYGDKDAAGQNTSDFVRQHGASTAVVNIRPTMGDRPDTQLTEAMVARRAFALKIAQNITHVHIYGDSEITVGDVIKCNFPAATDAKNAKAKSRLDSGNYLVAKVRHIITIGDRPQHTMALELVKGSMTETV